MASNPWFSSNELIAAVKRRISFPVYQSTFTPQEILDFANDAMREEVLANMMQYHQEFFVVSSSMLLETNRSSYPIPNRAVGMKLRDVMFGDNNVTPGNPYGNLYEMTNTNADDKGWFQGASLQADTPFRFYLEGNNVILVPSVNSNPTGMVVFYWFMRPNQLVLEERSFLISGFSKTITIDNTTILAGDTVTLTTVSGSASTDYTFTATVGAPIAFQFQIGATSSQTATNLANAINNASLGFSANNGTPATNLIKVSYLNRLYSLSASNSIGTAIQVTLGLDSLGNVPSNITAGSYIDLLQTLPGHKTLEYDVIVPINGVSGMTVSLNEEDVPDNFVVGDYLCSRNECIIPQIPPELQSGLVERTCARILNSIGDKEGKSSSDIQIQKLDQKEGNLIADRVDGAPMKVGTRHSILRYNSLLNRRRW